MLKLLKAERVTFLVLTVCLFVLNLQAVVGEVDVTVHKVVHRVALTGSTKITCVVEVVVLIAQGNSPDSYVKLSTLKKKWLFDVLLDDPV